MSCHPMRFYALGFILNPWNSVDQWECCLQWSWFYIKLEPRSQLISLPSSVNHRYVIRLIIRVWEIQVSDP